MRGATFHRRARLDGGGADGDDAAPAVVVEQRFFAHRALRSVLVHELQMLLPADDDDDAAAELQVIPADDDDAAARGGGGAVAAASLPLLPSSAVARALDAGIVNVTLSSRLVLASDDFGAFASRVANSSSGERVLVYSGRTLVAEARERRREI